MLDFARWLAHAALSVQSAASGSDPGYRDVVPAERVSAPLYVGLAYGVIWIVVMVYLLVLWRRQSRVAATLEHLQRQLDRDDAAPGA